MKGTYKGTILYCPLEVGQRLNREGLSLLLQGYISSVQRNSDLKKIDFHPPPPFTHCSYLKSRFLDSCLWTCDEDISLSAPP